MANNCNSASFEFSLNLNAQIWLHSSRGKSSVPLRYTMETYTFCEGTHLFKNVNVGITQSPLQFQNIGAFLKFHASHYVFLGSG